MALSWAPDWDSEMLEAGGKVCASWLIHGMDFPAFLSFEREILAGVRTFCLFFFRGGECGNEGCVVEVEMEVEMFFCTYMWNQEVSQGCGFRSSHGFE